MSASQADGATPVGFPARDASSWLSASASHAHWIKSPAWDLVWILNTLWLAPLILLLSRGYENVRSSPVDGLFFALAVPLWFGHRISSAWLAYATPAYREVRNKQRMRFVAAPLGILLFCFAFLLAPYSAVPMPLTERVVALAILDYLLVSYHFAAQHFGLLSLYRARCGRVSSQAARRLDRCYALIVGGGFVVVAEALAGSISFQERWIDPLLGAVGGDTVTDTVRALGVAVVATLTILMLAVELRSQQRSLARAAYIVNVSAMVLFSYLAGDPFLFVVLWSVQHWSAAMGLCSLAACDRSRQPVTTWHRLLAPVNRRGWAVLLVLAVASVLLLPLLEVEAVADADVYADRIIGDAAWWLRSSPLAPALLALGFATAFIHYLLDRATFRFSSPDVRNAARGLLQSTARPIAASVPPERDRTE